jgi:predicted RNase H-like HicB family nuclease
LPTGTVAGGRNRPPYDGAGASVGEVKAALAEVIPFHLDGLRQGGEPVPLPESAVEWVEV